MLGGGAVRLLVLNLALTAVVAAFCGGASIVSPSRGCSGRLFVRRLFLASAFFFVTRVWWFGALMDLACCLGGEETAVRYRVDSVLMSGWHRLFPCCSPILDHEAAWWTTIC